MQCVITQETGQSPSFEDAENVHWLYEKKKLEVYDTVTCTLHVLKKEDIQAYFNVFSERHSINAKL